MIKGFLLVDDNTVKGPCKMFYGDSEIKLSLWTEN
jgi:hypothetical protein